MTESVELVPLWLAFPHSKESIGWRMGAGDEYLTKWLNWWRTELSSAYKLSYRQRWPEPPQWLGFYDSLDAVPHDRS